MQPEKQESVANPFPSTNVAAFPQGALANAAAQREVAEVQAAMVIAKKFPRDPIKAMDRIMQACTRPTLAEVSLYQYSRGGTDITGPSIRLLEEVCRGWGNILCGVTELSRTDGSSECLAFAWDLETNFRDDKRFQVKHWRDKKNGGGYKLTDERDIYELIANMGARRKRACMESVIPGDVLQAARQQCEVTLKAKMDITPEFILSVTEAFEPFGVNKEMLEKRIQRRMDTLTPALAMNLKKILNSLKEGMSTAADWFEVEAKAEGAEAGNAVTGNAGAKEALKKRAQPVNATETVATAKQPEVKGEPKFSIKDALRSVNEGDYASAQSMVKQPHFTDNDRAEIESAIKRHKGGEKIS